MTEHRIDELEYRSIYVKTHFVLLADDSCLSGQTASHLQEISIQSEVHILPNVKQNGTNCTWRENRGCLYGYWGSQVFPEHLN